MSSGLRSSISAPSPAPLPSSIRGPLPPSCPINPPPFLATGFRPRHVSRSVPIPPLSLPALLASMRFLSFKTISNQAGALLRPVVLRQAPNQVIRVTLVYSSRLRHICGCTGMHQASVKQPPLGYPLWRTPLIHRQEGIHSRACVRDLRGIRPLPLRRDLRARLRFLYPLVTATRPTIRRVPRPPLSWSSGYFSRSSCRSLFCRAPPPRRVAKNFTISVSLQQCAGPAS